MNYYLVLYRAVLESARSRGQTHAILSFKMMDRSSKNGFAGYRISKQLTTYDDPSCRGKLIPNLNTGSIPKENFPKLITKTFIMEGRLIDGNAANWFTSNEFADNVGEEKEDDGMPWSSEQTVYSNANSPQKTVTESAVKRIRERSDDDLLANVLVYEGVPNEMKQGEEAVEAVKQSIQEGSVGSKKTRVKGVL